LASKYKDAVKKSYDGPTYQVIGDVFAGLVGKKVVGPSPLFSSAQGFEAVKGSQKANEILLYPLEKAFLCIPKPTLYMPFSEISSITFSRVNSASTTTKTFEIKVMLTSVSKC
jgi:structure-specific recognition protein 1